jgi:hypothetical protein
LDSAENSQITFQKGLLSDYLALFGYNGANTLKMHKCPGYLLFTAFSIPGPLVVFGRKQDLSEFPGGLAALIPCYQTAS